jgi:hypothetical protein
VVLGLTLMLAVAARGQWQVVYLHPEGAKSSDVHAAAGAQQGGRIEVLDDYIYEYHPVIWSVSAEDYIDLLPDGWRQGVVHGMDGPWQVGEIRIGFEPHAALWSGTPESFVDLRPGGDYGSSWAADVAADQQVGCATLSATAMHHAALWHGSPESFVDLHPPVARWSEALATDGLRQAGRAQFPADGYHSRAVLWEGSAESFIDMNPEGARESTILGMADGVQVGWGLFGTVEHGVLWHGTPESFVDMHPSEGYTSRLYDTTGMIHVGYVNYTGWAEAGIWMGDVPYSFENLHPLLGPEWFVSGAQTVCVHEGWLYVGGAAGRTAGRSEAVLWMRRLPSTASSPAPVVPVQILPRP